MWAQELETLDQLQGGDLSLTVVATFYSTPDCVSQGRSRFIVLRGYSLARRGRQRRSEVAMERDFCTWRWGLECNRLVSTPQMERFNESCQQVTQKNRALGNQHNLPALSYGSR